MSEPEIITQCQRGNREAQRALFENHFDRFMLISMRYAKDKNQAKEILYHSYGQLLNQLHEFQKADKSFEDWSKEQFIAHSIAFLKSKKNEYYVTTTVRVSDKKPGDDLFGTLSDEETYMYVDGPELLKAIQHLPPSFRATYNMCMIDGFDYKKASNYLEVSEDTARFNFEKANYHLHQNIQQFQKGYK